jgi:integrase
MNDPRKLQTGSLRQVAGANGKRAWEWRYVDPATGGVKSRTFPETQFPTLTKIEEHLADFIERLNKARTDNVIVDPTISSLIDRFIKDEKLHEIKNRKPGERASGKDELAYSTVTSYLSLCKLIREKWGATSLDRFKPLAFQTWLKEMDKSPKHKGHIKAFVNRLFNKAKLYELLNFHENPISLVEVRGISKRRRKPADLTVEQFFMIHSLLKKPYNDMSMVALCTGIRVEELLALQWPVIDFSRLCMKIEEGVVHGRIGPVKSEYSEDELPLDPDFATFLLELKRDSNGSSLVFPSPVTGHSYHASPIQQDWIRRAGWCLVECPNCGAVPCVACTLEQKNGGKRFNIPVHDERRELAIEMGFGSIGWHTFRHTYRSLLILVKAPPEVQKVLMRHAQQATTDNIYGGPRMEEKRKANSGVVQMIFVRKSAH